MLSALVGAGLPVLAVATTLGHFVIMLAFPMLVRRLPRPRRMASEIQISYEDGRELLRTILIRCTELRFTINHLRLDRESPSMESSEDALDMADYEGVEPRAQPEKGTVTLRMQVKGKRPISNLITTLSSIEGVYEVGLWTKTRNWISGALVPHSGLSNINTFETGEARCDRRCSIPLIFGCLVALIGRP